MVKAEQAHRKTACQTLFRGLDIIDAVANHRVLLPEISQHIKVSASTTYRLASALVSEGYLKFESGKGYSLGTKLIQLGFLAYNQIDMTAVARPWMRRLAKQTQDTVHLAMRDNMNVFYLDKVSGSRAVQISSIVGGHKDLCSTGVGKALILDESVEQWKEIYHHWTLTTDASQINIAEPAWLALMQIYAAGGYSFDRGEDAEVIHCVAAPIYDASRKIVAAISVSSAIQYMDEVRMESLIPVVKHAAREISTEMGYVFK